MIPRHQIIDGPNYAHVFFRCHNQQFLLKPRAIKVLLLRLWARFRARYSIKIIDFIIMDNHAHLLIYTPDAESLARFMRAVNSLLARGINKHFNRDSQAIRERYKSPMIASNRYLLQTIQYIWLNRFKVDSTRPEHDCFCSASWRLNGDLFRRFARTKNELLQLKDLLTSYRSLPHPPDQPYSHFVQDLINKAIGKLTKFTDAIYENFHTIADDILVAYRSEVINTFRRVHLPTADPPLSISHPTHQQ